jgi:hypothetical protein
MKQTAIEWLSEQIINAKYTYKLRDDLENFLLEKAKEMEKQQIIDAYNESELTQLKAENETLKGKITKIRNELLASKLCNDFEVDRIFAENKAHWNNDLSESLTHKER